MIEPANGAVRYTHRLAYVPDTTAGASDRAGLTEAPLICIEAKWMTARVSGMTKIPALGAFRVTVRITATKTAVVRTSIENACSSWPTRSGAVGPGWLTDILTTSREVVSRMASEASRAPATWA